MTADRRPTTADRRVRGLTLALLLGGAGAAHAQPTAANGAEVRPLPYGAVNTVSTLVVEPVADGPDRLYAGRQLVYAEDAATFRLAAESDPNSVIRNPLIAPEAFAFSLDAEGDTVWVGLGFFDLDVTDSNGDPLPSAAGFAVSFDRGASFEYRFPQLDADDATSVVYGVTQLLALPITELAESAPNGLSLDPTSGDVWVAGGRSGLRRSTDGGRTFRRMVLPPDTLDALDPREAQSFPYIPQGETVAVTVDGQTFQIQSLYADNFFALDVLVDEAGTVWAGTLAGVNRSDSSDVYRFQRADGSTYADRAWRRYTADGTPFEPTGNAVPRIRAQPVEGARDPVWFVQRPSCADRPAGDCLEEAGLSVWAGDDAFGEPVFEPRLLRTRVNDVAFDGARVFAAADDGLYAADDGRTFSAVRTFRDAAGAALPLEPRTGYLAAAVTDPGTPDAVLWVGTRDGLLRRRIADGGAFDTGWALYRAAAPVAPAAPTFEAPAVDAYVYPNPYVRSSGYARFRFDLDADGPATVRLFSYGMEPVRTLTTAGRAGANEVLWDGLADDGGRVATGVYVYVIEAGGANRSGRLIVAN